MIIPYFKPYGKSSHVLAKQVGELRGEKATHTGTLDPAAEGVLVVLTGDDRFKKAELSTFSKVYVAQILFGISTDTHDSIGFPTKIRSAIQPLSKETIKGVLQTFTGTFRQTQPAFSAQRVNGQSAFNLAKQGIAISPKENRVSVSSLEVTAWETLSLEELKVHHHQAVDQISGDFRQSEIHEKWEKLFEEAKSSHVSRFQLATVIIHCSKRTYIRSMVRDLAESLKIPAVLFSLIRTENGPYSIKDCLCLVTPRTT